jgi:hypothetical protein
MCLAKNVQATRAHFFFGKTYLQNIKLAIDRLSR